MKHLYSTVCTFIRAPACASTMLYGLVAEATGCE